MKYRAKIICLEAGTCSDRALSYYLEQHDIANDHVTIQRASTFECGIKLCKETDSSLILVPHLHQVAAQLSLSNEFELIPEDIFVLANPPLYLAAPTILEHWDSPAVKCAALATLVPLLNEKNMTIVYACNTQDAARKAAANITDTCITNEHGLNAYSLEPLRLLKQIDVVWLPFRRDV